jgi:hypothetical protein
MPNATLEIPQQRLKQVTKKRCTQVDDQPRLIKCLPLEPLIHIVRDIHIRVRRVCVFLRFRLHLRIVIRNRVR